MTLLPVTIPVGPVRAAAPVPDAAVPAQHPASEAVPQPDVFAAPDAADRALSSALGSNRDAVAWLSAQIATLDRVIYPAAGRHLHGTDELRAQRAATHRLALLVRRLQAQLDGDTAVAVEDLPVLRRTVLTALCEHSLTERDLLARLRQELTARQWTELAGQYAERLQRGPTRPHPHASRSGAAGSVAYRHSTWTDHVLDVFESRAVRPVPVQAVYRPPEH
jgi:hypothetical protein